jgi:hypothetical protein
MSDSEIPAGEIGWYVSDVHCMRAIGYLGAELVTKGYLSEDFEFPKLIEIWEDALRETMVMTEPSPLGPDPEAARKFLLATIEGRITQLEDRSDRVESAIDAIAKWLHVNVTRFGHTEQESIRKILYGIPETTPKSRPTTS